MSIRTWFRAPRVRHGLAASAVVLAAGGLVLARAAAGDQRPASAFTGAASSGSNSAAFSGPGAHGTFALSHTKVQSGGEQRVFAELILEADAVEQARERAPLSIAIVLDTSGSMAGEKLEQAKRSAVQLLRDLRDDDEIAFVRYSSDSELLQPLASAGRVRADLIARIQALEPSGGTNIAPALAQGALALADAGKGRVRRVILASDGLDGTRARSEEVARDSAGRGITTSSLGIGLDFDEAYMGAVAEAGRGNFAFVKDASALAAFLQRELRETAATTIEGASARLKLPAGVRLVRASGADARPLASGEVELALGSLFSGDERRVILELAASLDSEASRTIEGQIRWSRVGGDAAQAPIAGLTLTGSTSAEAVEAGKDLAVLADALSVVASRRQLEAADAYQQGDVGRAQRLIDQSMSELSAVAAVAPKAAAAPLRKQLMDYKATQKEFLSAPPSSTAGKAAAKRAVEKDISNLSRR
ncbi:vWA domain-containing protein [Sorangium sp. So ce542]|uniref:vWA domain-containing protein n=1 Tax=Sorangium sp. So ce542 TaxID=3133316 RepID=UPI003F633BB3